MPKCDKALEPWVERSENPWECVEDCTIWYMVHGYIKDASEHHKSSYADALDTDQRGEDHVGDAIALRSYSWSEKYHNVFDTLHDWAVREGLDPKRAYVWVCALCLNQVSAI